MDDIDAQRQHADNVPENVQGKRCKQIAETVLRVLLGLADEITVDGRIVAKDLHRIAEAIQKADGPLPAIYAEAQQQCGIAFQRASIEGLRRYHLNRLITQPFAALLDKPEGIERNRLGQLFLAIRMMIGEEEHEGLRVRAEALAELHRGADGIVDWIMFHADPEADLILESVLVGIANSFRRNDARRDWFLVVLNASPSAVSIGSTAFTPLKPEDRARFAFTEAHMAHVFAALFASVRRETFFGERLRVFGKRWNVAPDKLFGPLFVDIARYQ